MLNARQKRFVAEYLKDSNATQAAIRSGYSAKTAGSRGFDLLRKPEISEAVEKALETAGLTAAAVLAELKTFAHSDPLGLVDDKGRLKALRDMAPEVRRSIASIEIEELFEGRGDNRAKVGELKKVKFWPKDRGLELEGKHLKLFTDKVEHSGDVRICVVDPYAQKPGAK